MNIAKARLRMGPLAKEVEEHMYNYYVLDAPTIPDAVFDNLWKELVQLEKDFPSLKLKTSPTLRVGAPPAKGFEKVVHEVPMLSLDTIHTPEELYAWCNRIEKELKVAGLTGKQGELF